MKKAAVLCLAAAIGLQGPTAGLFGLGQVYAAERSAVVKATSVNVRSSASTDASILATLGSNTAITVIGEQRGGDGYTWYQIRYNGSNTGYVRSDYVKFPSAYQYDAAFESQLSAQGFPESYKNGLRQLHAEFPTWTFTAFHTGLDWNTVLEEELKGSRSLVGSTSISSYKSIEDGKFDWNTSSWPGFDGASWVAASREITAYYLDPRNFLDETFVFQFESQKYNASIHTADGLGKMISGTFLDATVLIPDENGTLNADGTPIQQTPAESTPTETVQAETAGTELEETTTAATETSAADATQTTGSGDETLIDYSGPTSQALLKTIQTDRFGEGNIVDAETLLTEAKQADYSISGQSTSVLQTDAVYTSFDTITISDVGPGGSSGTNSSTISGGSGGPGVTSGTSSSTGASGTTPTGGTAGNVSYRAASYAEIIMNAAQQSGVSPYVLAAMILQEQGSGTSDLISGTNAQYPGIYNYFNIGAYAENGMSAVQRGLWYASQSGSYNRPWNTIEKSIVNGAVSYAASYVDAGQDTFYLKKWNVQGSNMYKHQYMTNVEGAASEGAKYGAAYSADVKAEAHEFKIPVYTNMPETACEKPTGDGNPNNKLSGITIEGFTYSPSFDKDTTAYTLIVDPSVSSLNLSATALHSGAKIEGVGNISLNDASTTVTITVTAENGTQRQYTLTINKQAGGALPSGISTGTVAGADDTSGTSGSPVTDGSASGGPGVVSQSPVAETTTSGGSDVQIGVGPT